MIPFSFCIIARDEESHINKCLARISQYFKNYPHEIIILDTGSTDRTKEYARRYTDRIYDYKWIDDFSKAKNESIRLAANDWVFVVDCDEYLEEIDMEKFCLLLESSPENAIGTFKRRDAVIKDGILSVSNEMCPRVFSRKLFHYSGRVHEQLVSINEETEKIFLKIPITFYHDGYIELPEMKGKRNMELLIKELQNNPKDPYILYQLGKACDLLNDQRAALKYYEKALEFDVDTQLNYVQNLVEAYGYCLIALGYCKEALHLESVYSEFADCADFHFLMGHIYMNNRQFDKAVDEFKIASNCSMYKDEGVNGYKAWYNIGVIYECRGQFDDAVKYYNRCGDYEAAMKRIHNICNDTRDIIIDS